ncbi:MAG: hypothetical protein F6K18_31595 [Okeania sp. SIO2C2]|uniref:hypothetical protein n=1 Tax=Okeania sp. SIO2C2 TaxID=2607787 RepID=UPI0013B7BA5B|nr:hypothetical protein [Okeania sp. SIO2C2]NEP90996.1 hypothetical protein [Okeania sp. SIO2C2]
MVFFSLEILVVVSYSLVPISFCVFLQTDLSVNRLSYINVKPWLSSLSRIFELEIGDRYEINSSY